MIITPNAQPPTPKPGGSKRVDGRRKNQLFRNKFHAGCSSHPLLGAGGWGLRVAGRSAPLRNIEIDDAEGQRDGADL